MELDEIIALINAEIVANGNQEITADVLRPILLEMIQQPNTLIGDLNGLNTVDKTNLVSAINEVLEGGTIDQNNITKIYGTFGVSGTGAITLADVANYVNSQSWDIVVGETDTPVYVSFLKAGLVYLFEFIQGKGTYPTVSEDDFFLISVRGVTGADTETNSVTVDLGVVTPDFITEINTSTWDFSDSGELDSQGRPKSYYFTYTEDGELFLALFTGDPTQSPYGSGGTTLTLSDFVISSGGSSGAYGLQEVTNINNETTNPLVVKGGGYQVAHTNTGDEYRDPNGNTGKTKWPDNIGTGEPVFNWPVKSAEQTIAMIEDIDDAIAGTYRPAGNWDASGGTFPTTGTGGGVRAGDVYQVSVAGIMGGQSYDVGDSFYAIIDDPGQTASNWGRFEVNTGQASDSYRGTMFLYTGTGSNINGSVTQLAFTNAIADVIKKGTDSEGDVDFISAVETFPVSPGTKTIYFIESKDFEGSLTGTSDGVATTVVLSHGLGVTPSYINVQAKNLLASGFQFITCDSSSITITYGSAPAAGSPQYWVKYVK